MSDVLIDLWVWGCFCDEWWKNFVVSVNVGLGKMIVILEWFVVMVMLVEVVELLLKMVVVMFMKKVV